MESDVVHTLNLQKEDIILDMASVLSDLKFLSDMVEGSRFMEERNPQAQWELTEKIIIFMKAKGIYDQIRVMNIAGIEVIRVNYNQGEPIVTPREQLQDKSKRYYFKETLKLNRGKFYASPFDLNVDQGKITFPLKPMIRLGTPAFNDYGQKKGITIINSLGKRVLEHLSRISSAESGDFMLLNKDGYWLKGRTPEEEWGFVFQDRKDKAFAKVFPKEWQKIRQNESGQFYTQEGLFAFKTVFPLNNRGEASYYWKLVAHVSPPILANLSRQILTRFLLVFCFMTILLIVGCVFLTRAHSYRRRVEKVLKGLPQKIIQAHEEERENISREIHDDLGQSLVTLKILLQASQPQANQDEADLKKSYEKIIEYLNTIIEKTRDLAGFLRPSTLEVLGLSTTLETMINDFRHKKDLQIHFTTCRLDDLILKGEMINLYRIVQEALTNIVKHGKASEASITLKRTEDSLNVTIQDNGQGFRLDKAHRRTHPGLGLSTMAERTRLLNGTFDIQSQPKEGTTITVTVPVQVKRKE